MKVLNSDLNLVIIVLAISFNFNFAHAESDAKIRDAVWWPHRKLNLTYKAGQLKDLPDLIAALNRLTGKHFEVTVHAEKNSVDLSCFDCLIDELDSAEVLLAGGNNIDNDK